MSFEGKQLIEHAKLVHPSCLNENQRNLHNVVVSSNDPELELDYLNHADNASCKRRKVNEIREKCRDSNQILPIKNTVEANAKTELDFGADFVIPQRQEKLLLDITNPHCTDGRITFKEAEHKYCYDGTVVSRSVTELISGYFEKFDPAETAARMIAGRSWPRPQYTHADGTPFVAEEIVARWEMEGEQARNKGTWMHHNIELCLNNEVFDRELPEMQQFLRFQEEVMQPRGMVPYRTEWRIAAPDLSLAGSVDCVAQLPNGSFVILDWKRSKSLPNSIWESFKSISGPLSHLPDCDGTKYTLQLNMYRYILSRYDYNLPISGMLLASFHPAVNGYFYEFVPFKIREIESLVAHLKTEVEHCKTEQQQQQSQQQKEPPQQNGQQQQQQQHSPAGHVDNSSTAADQS